MTDINELFSRDPLKLTNENVDEMIGEYRKRRHMYNSGPAKPKASATSLTAAQKSASGLKIELKL